MIRLDFDQEHTTRDRVDRLAEYAGKTVTARTGDGEFSGELVLKNGRVTVGGTRLAAGNIASVDVHVGGDWSTKTGHQSGTKLERLWVRCTTAEKRKMIALAAKNKQTLSAWLLELAKGQFQ